MDEILKSLEGRTARWGIGVASQYLERLAAACDPKSVFNVAEADWDAAMKRAAGTLTYCDPEMDIEQKKRRESVPGSVMEFDAVVTSRRRDRDGDILEPNGATIDPRAPLLWQHVSVQPIGRLVAVLSQNKQRVKARFAIVDSPLGRDAAQLVEFDALRISHGFIPSKYERMLKDEEFIGWHIQEYELLEVSLVSVPSNVDAVITAWSRNGEKAFEHAAVRSWAHRLYEDRPKVWQVVVTGGDGCKCAEATQEPLGKSVVPYRRYPSMPKDAAWDAMGAVRRIRAWAKGDADELDLSQASHRNRYRQGFAFVRDDPENLGSYILPHHDVVDGALHTNYRGCVAVVAVLNGARGGVDTSDSDRRAVYSHVARHIRDGWEDTEPPELRAAGESENTTPSPITLARVVNWIGGANEEELKSVKLLVDHDLDEIGKQRAREQLGLVSTIKKES